MDIGNRPMTEREGGNRNYDAASGTILGISKGFRRSKQYLNIYVLFNQSSETFKHQHA
jgi:hypothetical protein